MRHQMAQETGEPQLIKGRKESFSTEFFFLKSLRWRYIVITWSRSFLLSVSVISRLRKSDPSYFNVDNTKVCKILLTWEKYTLFFLKSLPVSCSPPTQKNIYNPYLKFSLWFEHVAHNCLLGTALLYSILIVNSTTFYIKLDMHVPVCNAVISTKTTCHFRLNEIQKFHKYCLCSWYILTPNKHTFLYLRQFFGRWKLSLAEE